MDLPSSPPTCPDENVLSSFVEGNLGPDQASLIEAHIDGCERCHDVLAVYGRAYPRAPSRPSTEGSGVRSGRESVVSHGRLVDRLQRTRPLPPGKQIGRYVILEWLGEGGASVVYTAYDPKLDRKVGLKLLRPQASANEHPSPANLEAEARAMAKLAHPNVVAVHDVGTFEGQVFIAMEFMPGGTLRKWLRDSKQTVPQIVRAFVEAGRGLAAAHAVGLVHRDFKPENVLIAQDGHAKVADFGLALAQDDAPATAAGTPWYMAPEQKRGEAPVARSDQYSFCVALRDALESVTGKARVPPRIRRVLERGLSEAPEARYPSMVALLSDLATDRSVRWKGAAVLALGAVLSIASVAYAYRQNAQSARLVCSGAESKLVGVWDDARRHAIGESFARTGKPFADQTRKHVEAILDRYAHEWTAARTDACTATRVRREQSEQILDMRVACFDRQLSELRSLADIFVQGDTVVVERAVQAAQQLPAASDCAASRVIAAHAPLQPSAQVASIGDEVARAKSLERTGKYREAQQVADKAAALARAAGQPLLGAEATYELGRTIAAQWDYARGSEVLFEAFVAAERAGSDALAALVASDLAFTAAEQTHTDEGTRWLSLAEVSVERLGGDERLTVKLARRRAHLLDVSGRSEQAVEEYRRVVRSLETSLPDETLELESAEGELGRALANLGRDDEAEASHKHALQIDESELGPSHPRVAKALEELGLIAWDRGDYERAVALFQQVLPIKEGVGPAHALRTTYLLADVLGRAGRTEEARAELSRARSLAETTPGIDRDDLGYVHLTAADLALRERKLADALREVHLAQEILTTVLGPNHPDLARPLVALGRCYLAQGQAEQALVPLERAYVLFEKRGTLGDRAEGELVLAQALLMAHRDRGRAVTLARQAFDSYEKLPGRERDVSEVIAWFKQRGLSDRSPNE